MKKEFSTYNFNLDEIKKYFKVLKDKEKKIEYLKWIKTKYDFRKSKGISPISKALGVKFSDLFLELGIWIKNEYEHLIKIQPVENTTVSNVRKKGMIDKITWNRKPDVLEELFSDLYEQEYIGKYKEENIYEHFEIKKDKQNLLDNKQSKGKKILKIRWLKHQTKLVYLIKYLFDEGVISITGDKIHYIAYHHFRKRDNSDFNTHTLAQTKKNIIDYLKDGKNPYPELKELIDYRIKSKV